MPFYSISTFILNLKLEYCYLTRSSVTIQLLPIKEWPGSSCWEVSSSTCSLLWETWDSYHIKHVFSSLPPLTRCLLSPWRTGASGKHPPFQSTLFCLHCNILLDSAVLLSLRRRLHHKTLPRQFLHRHYLHVSCLRFISEWLTPSLYIVGGWKVKPERSDSGVQTWKLFNSNKN